MHPDPIVTENDQTFSQRPVSGLTFKVVKGSLWTAAGQVGPMAVSLVATPFTIRLLGSEGYGAFVLLGLIPNYLLFADMGMSMASTKFASEAYASEQSEKEAGIVRTAALLALIISVPLAILLFSFADQVLDVFTVPEHLRFDAVVALRLASMTFVISLLCGIFNTPQLTRLRMDLNTMINAGSRIAGLIATPIVIYLGYGLIGAATVLLIAAVLNLIGHLLVSRHLLAELFSLSIDKPSVRPMLRFGGALALSSIAAGFLTNAEKGILAATVSTEALAFYSVAFMLASITILFAGAMTQSLIPAFSQLISPEKAAILHALFARGVMLILVALIPGSVFLFIVAQPFFTAWAGTEFGQQSTLPFYILLAGLLINIPAFVPYSLLISLGKTEIVAKLYWLEIIPYAVLVFVLTHFLGVVGAALAWSVRMAFDGLIFFWLAKKEKVSGALFRNGNYAIPFAAVFYIPVLAINILFDISLVWIGVVFALTTVIFFLAIWRNALLAEERTWLLQRSGLRS